MSGINFITSPQNEFLKNYGKWTGAQKFMAKNNEKKGKFPWVKCCIEKMLMSQTS
jgi:hypothetical protein